MSNFAPVMTTRFSEKLKVVSFMAILAVFYLHASFPEEVIATMRIPTLVRHCIAETVGHCAVPMFYAISGFLFFKGIHRLRQVFEKMRKRVKTLLVPFVIAALLFAALYGVVDPARFADKSPWAILYAIFYDAGNWMPMGYHLWFLRDLIIVVALSPVLYDLRKYMGLWSLVILIPLYWYFPYTLFTYAAIWFMAGSLLLDKLERIPRWAVYGLFTVFILAVLFRLNYGRAWKYVNILEISAGITSLWCLYDIILPKDFRLKSKPALALACQFTFFLYLYHEPLFHVILKVFPMLLGHNWIAYTLSFLLSPLLFLPIGIGVGYALRRFTPRLYAVITGGRDYQAHWRFPAEWEPQECVQLTWPHAGTDWAPMLDEITATYEQIAQEIAKRESLLIVTPAPLSLHSTLPSHNVLLTPTNDTWARDHGFITLVDDQGDRQLLDYCFNGWGEKFPAELDNAINRRLHEEGRLKGTYINCLDFVLEGGSIESDGKGTVFTTSGCLLAPHRNQPMTKALIEQRLLHDLHAQRILWIDHGNLTGDDTDGHIDTLVRIAPDDTLLYIGCDDPQDEQYEELKHMEAQLKTFRTLEGKPYRLIKLPTPRPILFEGERLPATYANFLVVNGAVLCPTYDQPDLDAEALRLIGEAFPDRDIVGIDCRSIIKQHGSLHCCTMQYPKGKH